MWSRACTLKDGLDALLGYFLFFLMHNVSPCALIACTPPEIRGQAWNSIFFVSGLLRVPQPADRAKQRVSAIYAIGQGQRQSEE